MFHAVLRSGVLALGLVLSTVVTSEASAVTYLDCQSHPGATVCREMRILKSNLVGCNGNACYNLWNAQIRSMEGLTNFYYRYVGFNPAADLNIGSGAQDLAIRLCAQQWRGDINWINQIMISANRVIGVLAEIQRASGIAVPSSCTFNQLF